MALGEKIMAASDFTEALKHYDSAIDPGNPRQEAGRFGTHLQQHRRTKCLQVVGIPDEIEAVSETWPIMQQHRLAIQRFAIPDGKSFGNGTGSPTIAPVGMNLCPMHDEHFGFVQAEGVLLWCFIQRT